MAELINLHMQYLDTAGHHDAFLPDMSSATCLKRSATGEIEYDFGWDSFMTPYEISVMGHTTPKKSAKKRGAENTPQKGRRKKIPLRSSTPRKFNMDT